MTTRTFKLSVDTTVKQLCTKCKGLFVANNGTATVCIISTQNMVAADGIPIYAKEWYSEEDVADELYIIAESGTQDVRVKIKS